MGLSAVDDGENWPHSHQVHRYLDDLLAGNPSAGSLTTGLPTLDEALDGGLRPGHLWLVAGAGTGVGASTLALGVARQVALRSDAPVMVVAPDAREVDVLERIVAAESLVPLRHLRSGRLTAADREAVVAARDRLTKGRLLIHAASASICEPEHVAALVAEWAAWGARLIVIDPLEAFSRDATGAIRLLKQTALAHGVTVVVATQDPHHLAEIADGVVLVRREDLERSDSVRPGEADLHLLKNRYGPTRVVPVHLQAWFARFVDSAP